MGNVLTATGDIVVFLFIISLFLVPLILGGIITHDAYVPAPCILANDKDYKEKISPVLGPVLLVTALFIFFGIIIFVTMPLPHKSLFSILGGNEDDIIKKLNENAAKQKADYIRARSECVDQCFAY